MKHLTILVPGGEGNISSIAGSYKLFSQANEYRMQCGERQLFKIELAGSAKKVNFHEGLFTVQPHTYIQSISKTDLIIIPSLNHNYLKVLKSNKAMITWIFDQYQKGAEVASICTGAFMLASTGLLNGKTCSTHWAAAEAFKSLYPEVNLQADQMITDENGIYTNGGAYSFLNLIIYLIEKYYDRPTAIHCAKVFQIEMDRNSQSPFAIFTGQKMHSDEMVKEAQNYMESRIEDKLSVAHLSARFAAGRRNFDRRFVKATGNTPIEYLQRIKVEHAKKEFESSGKTIQQVMYDVGYSDAKAFREVFRKITGLSPLAYRERYHK